MMDKYASMELCEQKCEFRCKYNSYKDLYECGRFNTFWIFGLIGLGCFSVVFIITVTIICIMRKQGAQSKAAIKLQVQMQQNKQQMQQQRNSVDYRIVMPKQLSIAQPVDTQVQIPTFPQILPTIPLQELKFDSLQ